MWAVKEREREREKKATIYKACLHKDILSAGLPGVSFKRGIQA